ncbi:MAG TPA: ABC transporter substrate-binding protein [Candidatus Binatia bacterium]
MRKVGTKGRMTLAGVLQLACVSLLYAAQEASPRQVIETLHDGMIAVMRDSGASSFDSRAARLEPLLDTAFDLDFMARKSLGRAFDKLPADEQQRWIATFRRFMVANYAGRMKGYDGQRFETLGEEPAAQDTVLVRTRLIDPGAENMDLAYRLRRTKSGWKVIDVYLKGTVSELSLRRADFTAILEREGFPALLASVDAKIADLAAGKVK